MKHKFDSVCELHDEGENTVQEVCPYLTFFFQLMTYMTTLKLFSGGNETKHWQQKIQNSTYFIISFVPTATKGPTKRQTKKVPLPRVLKVPKALIAKKAVKVREVGIIAAAARLVSVMKRKLNRRAALIQGKLPRRKLTVGNRQTEHELH